MPPTEQQRPTHQSTSVELRQLEANAVAFLDEARDPMHETVFVYDILRLAPNPLGKLHKKLCRLLLRLRQEGFDHPGQVLPCLPLKVDDETAIKKHDLNCTSGAAPPKEVARMHVAMHEAVLEDHRPERVDNRLPSCNPLGLHLVVPGMEKLRQWLARFIAHHQHIFRDPTVEHLRHDHGPIDGRARAEALAEAPEVLRLLPQVHLCLKEVCELPQHQREAQPVQSHGVGDRSDHVEDL
mmetsp:Transcript_97870/g.204079  ORF Transcript_97870/g.204079 Transcript_97870/m.204079 type:complete len:239 (-) Transcript_97870:1249-1965(-)|eukprot:CAMPEP_0206542284 /NCGR_PEP_ID=MMETSP0325_2-20121206/10080_1 /ASSEMBLY_ACC=CAM_ASM_000347 /TAXON_ID=2866 /ORGANISM="Crypthecodinium cohnii, Strain Seligo" /LENGTH=238 /DNA_ID=CAMNT_0054040311 /DNA_START=505 /DNA_END=1221 /DNA_ORIENTATION=-